MLIDADSDSVGKVVLNQLGTGALFVVVGLTFLGMCFYLLYAEKVAEAAVVFGLGFLSFIYANVARFKRFKGPGFEAELWEDKKKEAAGGGD